MAEINHIKKVLFTVQRKRILTDLGEVMFVDLSSLIMELKDECFYKFVG